MRNRDLRAAEVTSLVGDLQRLAARFDPDRIPSSDVRGTIDDLGQAKRLIEGMVTVMARRTVELSKSSSSGEASRDAAKALAKATGTTPGRAKRTMNTSRRLLDQPDVADAVRSGALSDEQANAISDAVESSPDASNDLINAAKEQTLSDLKRTCRDRKAAADPTPDLTRQRHHQQRSCNTWHESDGQWKAMLSGPSDFGARFEAAIRGEHDQIFRAAHAAGHHEPTTAYKLDALIALLERDTAKQRTPHRSGPSRSDTNYGSNGSTPLDDAADRSSPQGTTDPSSSGSTCRQTPDLSATPTQPDTTPTSDIDEANRWPGQVSKDDASQQSAGQGDSQRPSDQDPSDQDQPHQGRRFNRDAIPDRSPPDPLLPHDPPPRRRSGRQTKIIITIDAKALQRGFAEPGETCHIAGVGRVGVAAIKDLIPNAHIAYVINNATDTSVAHLGRQATAHQRTALEARGYECEVPNCRSTHLLEIDHVRDWAHSHKTELSQLAWLCPAHHRQKSRNGHTLSGTPGRRSWHRGNGTTLSRDDGQTANDDTQTTLGQTTLGQTTLGQTTLGHAPERLVGQPALI